MLSPILKAESSRAVMTVDDENYDLSGIKGLNGNKLTREVEVSFKKAVPAVTVTTDPFSALPGTKITVSVSAVNPNNAKFSDVPAAELSTRQAELEQPLPAAASLSRMVWKRKPLSPLPQRRRKTSFTRQAMVPPRS